MCLIDVDIDYTPLPPFPQMEIGLMYKYKKKTRNSVSQPVSQFELTPLFDGMQRLLDPGLRHLRDTDGARRHQLPCYCRARVSPGSEISLISVE